MPESSRLTGGPALVRLTVFLVEEKKVARRATSAFGCRSSAGSQACPTYEFVIRVDRFERRTAARRGRAPRAGRRDHAASARRGDRAVWRSRRAPPATRTRSVRHRKHSSDGAFATVAI